MRRTALTPALLVLLAAGTLAISGCGSRAPTVSAVTGEGAQKLEAQSLRRLVDAFGDRLVSRISNTADKLDLVLPDPDEQRRTLNWRLRAAQAAFRAQHESNAMVALIGLWYWTASTDAYTHSPAALNRLKDHAEMVQKVSGTLREDAEGLATRALKPEVFKRIKDDIDKSAASGDLFSADAVENVALMDQLLSVTRLESLLSIPLSVFESFGSVSQGAEAVGKLAVTADRAVDLGEKYPQILEWRLRLLLLSLEQAQTTRSVVGNLDRLTKLAEDLPTKLREEVATLLKDSTPAQQEAQRTLKEVREAGVAMSEAMKSTDAAIARLDSFIAGLMKPDAPAAGGGAGTAKPTEKTEAKSAAEPFRVTDYTAAFIALTASAKELRATIADLQQPALGGRAKEAADAAVDHLMWRVAQAIVLAFVCGLILIVVARWKRKA